MQSFSEWISGKQATSENAWTAADDTLDVRNMVHHELVNSKVNPQLLNQDQRFLGKVYGDLLRKFGKEHSVEILKAIQDYSQGNSNHLYSAPYAR